MIACQIKNIKHFMESLLGTETFDKFSLEEGRIVINYTIEIDGRVVSDYYTAGDESAPTTEFITWKDIRPAIFSMMKVKHTPVSFQFTLHADKEYTNRLIAKHELAVDPEQVKCLLVNIRFEHGKLTCITGSAFHTFVPDKTLDQMWDSTFRKSLDTLHIDFEEL